MATFQPVRRLILAGGFVVAMALAPVAAGLADPASPHSVADCTTTKSANGSYALACAPDAVLGDGGAPSEGDLTAINSQRGFFR